MCSYFVNVNALLSDTQQNMKMETCCVGLEKVVYTKFNFHQLNFLFSTRSCVTYGETYYVEVSLDMNEP